MSKTEDDTWRTNPTPTQILQMAIGYHDPETDVFDEFGVDLKKGAELIESYANKKVVEALKKLPRAGFVGSNGIRLEVVLHSQIDDYIAQLEQEGQDEA